MKGISRVAVTALGLLGLAGSALAQGTVASPQVGMPLGGSEPAPRVTADTRSVQGMLELQRSQQLASPHPQYVSGDVQARIYRRYVESFSHPIPERYIDTRFSGQ